MNKSEINDAVNKVKEVVNGVSNNDIILALHSFDFNVEKTIQAFCEDGASGVLDDWVRPAGSSKKNKNKKKKPESSVLVLPAPAKVAPTPPVTAAPSASPAPVAAAPAPKAKAVAKPTPAATSVNTNRVVNETKAHVSSAPSNSVHEAFEALRNAISEREQILLASYNKNSSFVGDVNQLISQIRNFGTIRDNNLPNGTTSQQKAASPVQTGIKHATSQSSISSSVGADSGVNLSPTHQDDKKASKNAKVAQVAAGGIQLSSDALSEDQLAALQRTLQESLAARGIDANVLSGLTNGNMPARKQQRKPQDRKGGQKDGKTRVEKSPELSILGGNP